MAAFTVVYDACVLYPAPLRDLLMQIAVTDLVRARWTDQIIDEWIRNLLKNRPDLDPRALDRTRTLMNAHTREALVTGYEHLIPGLELPDPDDRHVLAAAIKCGAGAIVTFNGRHFPKASVSPYGIETLDPDDFVADLLDLHEEAICAAAKTVRERLKKPPKSVEEFLEGLVRSRLTVTASQLARFADLL